MNGLNVLMVTNGFAYSHHTPLKQSMKLSDQQNSTTFRLFRVMKHNLFRLHVMVRSPNAQVMDECKRPGIWLVLRDERFARVGLTGIAFDQVKD